MSKGVTIYQPEEISHEVQELINYNPRWIVRQGNVLFFLILVLVLVFTWFIHYPDFIKGNMKLVATNAPKLLISKTEGKLAKLLVSNEQKVVENQPLAFLQSTADHRQVLALQNWIHVIEPFVLKDSFDILVTKSFDTFDQLGEIQSDFQNFQSTLKETLQILDNGYYQKKKAALLKDMTYLASIKDNAQEQKHLLNRDYEIQQLEYKANETLAKDSVIAPLELRQNESKVIVKGQGVAQMQAEIFNSSMNEQNKKKEILDVQKYITDQKQKFRSELFNLKSKVEAWVEQYVVVAPENGKILFVSFLMDNQFISAGQELFYVQPPQSVYYGQLTVSQSGLGKIKTGQKVIVRLQSFPSNEFGYISGVINYISNIPTARDSFLIKVDLPNGLHTNYNKTIFFKNNLMADAEVVTDNRRLIDRFFGQLKDITRR